jgi:hypothetical protein
MARFLSRDSRCRNQWRNGFFAVEFLQLKLSVSGTKEQVDGDATHLYIRLPLPDAGREAA